jgi:hypothetical protein
MAASPGELHSALNYCIQFAKEMLEKKGAFYPFGASLSPSGELGGVGGWNGDEHPKPIELYRVLADSVRDQARTGKISGAAIAVDVNIPSQYEAQWRDAIRIHLESADFSRFIYVPYQVVKSGLLKSKRRVNLAEPFSVEINPEFFLEQVG